MRCKLFPCLRVVAIVTLSLCLRGTKGYRLMEVTAIQIPAGRDSVFSDHALWTRSSRSVVSCCAQCARDPQCLVFSFNKRDTGQGCRGHSDQPGAGGQWSPGARLYVVSNQGQQVTTAATSTTLTTLSVESTTADVATTAATISIASAGSSWFNTPCTADSDCSALTSNMECLYSFCICTPGFFFSLSTAQCLSSCPAADLSHVFVAYPNFKISGHHLFGSLQTLGLDECLESCVTSPVTCPSVDFNAPSTCGASDVSRFDVGTEDWSSHGTIVHYQRSCQ